jgi:hypothetical protein
LVKIARVQPKEEKTMEYESVVQHFSPCGLDCTRCVEYRNGKIKELAATLRELLGNYDRVARLRSAHNPLFKGYSTFTAILDQFSDASCSGCRSGVAMSPVSCNVKSCHKEKGADFCFQCAEYPCQDPMDRHIKGGWKERNDRMKAVGVVELYNEQIKTARY